MTTPAGHRTDRDRHARGAEDPGPGHRRGAGTASRHVAATTRTGTVAQASFRYRALRDIGQAGTEAPPVAGSHPGGRPDERF
ncbi:hypothetical protein [Paracraurococcus lichenis]|uniref:Uncharacterized protein n=1 Tax=Paracraurococcus lichenis TaxID=3064888 RepID=A0ABT9DYC6_9PROT|nr:hypothetical protein [Paracraurococcus sp. LOR1-02]MDO9708910.1 hypothetical protein [Paracraurococcus sp. LOR1-02]